MAEFQPISTNATVNCLAEKACVFLKLAPNLDRVVEELPEQASELETRVRTFERTISSLNLMLTREDALVNPRFYSNVLKLKKDFGVGKLPNLATLSENPKEVLKTFRELRKRIGNGEWGYIKEIEDSGKIETALLIEGFGLHLERTNKKKGLSRQFVLAFEEVLIMHAAGMPLEKDARFWMREEKEAFSPLIAKILG